MIHPASRLREIEQRARRRFGQNFLTSEDSVLRIVHAAGVVAGDRVLEVGPGLGILTEELRGVGADLRCIEIDRDLAAALRELWPDLALTEADALRADLAAICPGSGWKVVANLPYNVATPLLLRMVGMPGTFSSMVLMFQREVGDRILARPSTSARGSLSVQVQARAKVRPLLHLPPGAFHPPPKVHSVVLGFELLPEPDVGPAGPVAFDKVVRLGFQHRRKTLLNSLGSGMPKPVALAALEKAGIDPMRRAETLDLPEWRRIAAVLAGVELPDTLAD